MLHISKGIFAPEDMLSMKILTRIGTISTGQKCSGPGGSHGSAEGLRLYYDSPERPSGFGIEISSDRTKDLFLHSRGSAYYLDNATPAGTSKYKDSGRVKYNNGNPWKEIGTWLLKCNRSYDRDCCEEDH